MKIFLGSDHAGFELKNKIRNLLEGLGEEVFDKGPSAYDEGDDYPDFIAPVAREVSKNPKTTRGIILGASGQGEAMVANRFSHVRATVYYGGTKEILKLSREHNDANVLSLGARFLSEEEAFDAVKVWLATPFSKEERHERRIAKIENVTDANDSGVCSV